jgi:hypothetical protein
MPAMGGYQPLSSPLQRLQPPGIRLLRAWLLALPGLQTPPAAQHLYPQSLSGPPSPFFRKHCSLCSQLWHLKYTTIGRPYGACLSHDRYALQSSRSGIGWQEHWQSEYS